MKSSLRLVKSMDYALCERDISPLKIGHGKGMECYIKGELFWRLFLVFLIFDNLIFSFRPLWGIM
jgi:hypothetical protein